MSKKIIILAIPGIGTKKVGFSAEFEKDVRRFVNPEVRDHVKIIEARPFSITEVDDNQESLFRRLDAANKLGGVLSLRRFVLEAFGDGVTFERDGCNPESNYYKIHTYLKSKIEEVNALLNSGDIFVIVAASMGAHILSTYMWDADHGKGIFSTIPATDIQKLENLSHLSTIGCNIPLFVSGFPESKIVAINKPNANFTWHNYYDRDDVLGWPLRQLSPSYNDLVSDFEINTGLYVGSHVKYWDDNDFTKPFCAQLNHLFSS